MFPKSFRILNSKESERLPLKELKEYNFLLWFYESCLASEGSIGESDSYSHYQTYVVNKKAFNYSLFNLVKTLPKRYNEDAEKDVHLFSRFSKSWSTYSPYDCTGQLIGHRQEVDIIDKDFCWIIIVTQHYSYDL